MSEKLNRKSLPESTQEELERILAKDVGSISDEEKGFLKARRNYLTKAEREEFGIKMGKKAEKKAEKEAKKEAPAGESKKSKKKKK